MTALRNLLPMLVKLGEVSKHDIFWNNMFKMMNWIDVILNDEQRWIIWRCACNEELFDVRNDELFNDVLWWVIWLCVMMSF